MRKRRKRYKLVCEWVKVFVTFTKMNQTDSIMDNITTTVSTTTSAYANFTTTDANPLDFKKNPQLFYLMSSCICTGLWLLYLIFYNSRFIGFVVRKLLEKFVIKEGELYIGNSDKFSRMSFETNFEPLLYTTGSIVNICLSLHLSIGPIASNVSDWLSWGLNGD